MRCTFKVASRNGLVQIERRTPYGGANDGKATSAYMFDLVSEWDRYEAEISECTKDVQTPKALRSVARAFRFDSWVYVRLEVTGFFDRKIMKYKLRVDVSMSDPNHATEEELAAGRKMADELAELVLVRREISKPELKELITWNHDSEFLARADKSEALEEARKAVADGSIKNKRANSGLEVA